ncbi:translation initiation factor eIF4e [Hymenopellis radicata]|nr:translation initiation factor eIF4e [Hymenopellis radicata]
MTSTNERPSAANRPPSLNQLAARINVNSSRLAAFALRAGGSTTSLASTADSVAVNTSGSTRSASPSSVSTEGAAGSEAADVPPGDALTAETLEKHNILAEKSKVPRGYKNIPSLDAITARLAKTRALSIDGTSKPPDAEFIPDPKTPGLTMEKPEHPLQYHWTIYHDTKAPMKFGEPGTATDATFPTAAESDYEANLTLIGEFSTVESFCRYFNWLKPPSKLEKNANYHLFKQGIKPMWEDPANANGGKWVLTMKNAPDLLDRCWFDLCMALVGEQIESSIGGSEDGEICGAVVSLRSKVDRIQVWVRSKDNVGRVNDIGKRIVEVLGVSDADGVGVEFQYNSEDRPPPGKFFGTPGGTPTTGAFGSFGIGLGGSGWRGGKRS